MPGASNGFVISLLCLFVGFFYLRTFLICLLKDFLGLLLSFSSLCGGLMMSLSLKVRWGIWSISNSDKQGKPLSLVIVGGRTHRLLPSSPLSGFLECKVKERTAFHHPWGSRETGYWVWLLSYCHYTLHLSILPVNSCVCSNCTGKDKFEHNSFNKQIEIKNVETPYLFVNPLGV